MTGEGVRQIKKRLGMTFGQIAELVGVSDRRVVCGWAASTDPISGQAKAALIMLVMLDDHGLLEEYKKELEL